MGALKNILGNWIVKNILLAIVALVLLVIVSAIFLNLITNHGKVIVVPDLTGMTVEQAHDSASRAGVRLDVIDSIYSKSLTRGAIFSQNPKAGSSVKKGRRVQLVINSMSPKKIRMPNLVGYTMRQAKAELSSKGLNLRKLIYVNDIATNNVLGQLHLGVNVRAGSMIDSGSDIDLEVGLNQGDDRTYVPDLKGLKYRRAMDVIHENSLNVGQVYFDKSVRHYSDSVNAVVYYQNPSSSGVSVLMGTSVSIRLTVDDSHNVTQPR